jgi:glycosyltransferase involved in cell wall biosynthesis
MAQSAFGGNFKDESALAQRPSILNSCVVITAFAPLPSSGGAHMRIASTIAALARDFDVHVICTDTRPQLLEDGTDFCRENLATLTHDPSAFGLKRKFSTQMFVRYIMGSISPKSEAFALRELSADTIKLIRSADLIWLFKQTPFRVRAFPDQLDSPVVFDVDDIEERVIAKSTNCPKRLRSLIVRKTVHQRDRLLKQSNVALVCSTLDAERLDAPCPVKVLPNTYPATDASPPCYQPSSRRAVMIGQMKYFPNTDGVRWFLESIWEDVRTSVPDAHFTVAGRDSDKLLKPDPRRNIDVIGQFDDPTPILSDAAVVVVPLRHGSGTRVKILEAFAHGVPVVSTTIGAEGLDVVHGESILIADDPVEFAKHVAHVLQNREFAAHIAAGGRALFHAKYCPDTFSKTVLSIAREALQQEAPIATLAS